MGLLKVIEDQPGYCKATFQGKQGSGKTFTAVQLALRIHKVFGSTKPIAFYDTETGSDYIAHIIEEGTGKKPLRLKSRRFDHLIEVTKECVAGASDILLADSITHVWRELQDAHMAAENEERLRRNWSPKARMAIDDIMKIKERWQPWPDLFLNSPVHILVCGREGAEWGHEENEETGKRDLVQVGHKMKVEGEFGYEASLQVAMSIRQNAGGLFNRKEGNKTVRDIKPRELIQVATIIKDRFDEMNGQMFEMPEGEVFDPFLKRLNPQLHKGVNVEGRTPLQADVQGYDRSRGDRDIAIERIENAGHRLELGTSAKDKALKVQMLERVFGTASWTEISHRLPLPQLQMGSKLFDKWCRAAAASRAEGIETALAVKGAERVLDEPMGLDEPAAKEPAAKEPTDAQLANQPLFPAAEVAGQLTTGTVAKPAETTPAEKAEEDPGLAAGRETAARKAKERAARGEDRRAVPKAEAAR